MVGGQLINGFVNVHREAVIRIEVRGPQTVQKIEAVVDTGFNGFLTLPSSLISALDLPFRERGRVVLADGSDVSFDIHEAEIMWDERPRTIAVGAADTEPLIGTSLLDGYELTVRFVDDGDVLIEAFDGPRN